MASQRGLFKYFKEGMKRQLPTDTLETRISKFLMWYRCTPHSTTGVPPAELLLGRLPRSILDLMKPDLTGRVQERQALQKKYHDHNTKERKFNVGDQVFIREFPNSRVWLPG